MYYYLYDSFLGDRKYEKVLDKIKTQLLDLDIQGKHERLSLLKNVDSLIADESKRGVKTVVVIGNDKTFLRAVDAAAKAGVTLGIIPIGEQNEIAKILGIPAGEQACGVVAARKIGEFDLGKVNGSYFFSKLEITKNIDRISISHQGYKVLPKSSCSEISVVNFLTSTAEVKNKALRKVGAQDNLLDLVFRSQVETKGWKKIIQRIPEQLVDSVIQGVNFEIKSFEYLPVMLDGYKVIKTPISVKLADIKLKIIVGKNKEITIK